MGGLEGGLKDVIGEEVAAQVQEVVHDVHVPLLRVALAQNLLGLGVARVDQENQTQAWKNKNVL